MNTKIYYLYRDASNYKVQNEIVVEGEYDKEDVEAILGCCEDGEYFVPENVGWPLERFSEVTEDDHCFAELDDDSFELVDDPATDVLIGTEWRPMTIGEVVACFEAAADEGWTAMDL